MKFAITRFSKLDSGQPLTTFDFEGSNDELKQLIENYPAIEKLLPKGVKDK